MIEAIGDWVIGEISRQLAEWSSAGLDLRVGFNLSPRELWSVHLPERVSAGCGPKASTPRGSWSSTGSRPR